MISRLLVGLLTLCVYTICAHTGLLQAATLPQIQNGSLNPPKPPTKVLECNLPALTISGISPTPNQFSNCVGGKAQAYANAVASEQSEALNETISGLQTQIATMLPPEVEQCLAQLNTSTSAAISSAQNNPSAFVNNRMNALADAVEGTTQTLLNVNLNKQESAQARANRFLQALNAAAAADPVTACLFQIPASAQNQILNQAFAQAELMRVRMENLYREQLQERVYGQIRGTMSAAFSTFRVVSTQSKEMLGKTSAKFANSGAKTANQAAAATGNMAKKAASMVPVPEHVALLAKGLLAEMMLNPTRLNGLAGDLNAVANSSTADANRLQRLTRGLAVAERVPDAVAVNLGIRVLREYGHSLISTAGSKAIDLGFDYIDVWKTVVLEVVDIPCATGVWYSEAACSVGEGVVSAIMTFAASELEALLLTEIHNGYDALVTDYHESIKQNGAPLTVAQQNPLLAPLLQHFPNEQELLGLMLPEIRAMSNAMRGYHRAVGTLVGKQTATRVAPSRKSTTNRKR